jgi:hypothetical protein
MSVNKGTGAGGKNTNKTGLNWRRFRLSPTIT